MRIFGSLRPSRTDRGLPHEFTFEVPAEGVVARELAESFGLPTERVEGVFVNHTVRGLGVRVMPGDCIGFVQTTSRVRTASTSDSTAPGRTTTSSAGERATAGDRARQSSQRTSPFAS